MAKLSLFPQKQADLKTECSCPDWSNPCKHVAAVYYLLGEEFDRDPFLLFRLRGLSRDELVRQLGKAKVAGPTPAPAEEGPAAGQGEGPGPPAAPGGGGAGGRAGAAARGPGGLLEGGGAGRRPVRGGG